MGIKLIPKGLLANHLFKGAGKLSDNPTNRTLIQKIANGKPLEVDAFTGGLTVRQWLSTQSYQAQYNFGIQTLKSFGWKP